MQPEPHSFPPVPPAKRPPGRVSRAPRSHHHNYPATAFERNHHFATRQKPPVNLPLFDFFIPEERLLLTQFPRVARPRNSPRSPHRVSPPRILPARGLTNGVRAVMIDCMHGAKHSLLQSLRRHSAEGSRGWGWRGAYIRLRVIDGTSTEARHDRTLLRARWPGRDRGEGSLNEPWWDRVDAEISLGSRRAFCQWIDQSAAGCAWYGSGAGTVVFIAKYS
jgi:hypothetical protein